MRKFIFGLACAVIPWSEAMAADKPATAAEIKKLVIGHDINSGGAILHYDVDGSYTYNGQYPGKYEISRGKICVTFNAGGIRCDQIVVDGTSYTLINFAGKRFNFDRQ